nr:MAG TPA: hypothetical protein [Caudoviricetes sp.]
MAILRLLDNIYFIPLFKLKIFILKINIYLYIEAKYSIYCR